ncbi:conserved hypothetical protein [Theileria orientalis strain Shintoku]|uniref:Uncharacterized protein n=1 Tax=Theileria orientalis strain Shintoku TaxID=869250 RepID=J4C7N7_THEOR|nr:conserved hypothetical protein [Theileria orientalis strain Shintoku]PVC54839.1 hypothetical protein MACL_00003553 [Theileria orientalis]BAM39358.1 conserved hypothetical protein [Theileria orientalis strain Shintoku]|eukprot:XP_009689659.1 conserved hypothetical protein [Theileria orientalis strain Shintoku]
MNLSIIALILSYLTLLWFPQNVSGLKRNSSHDKASDNSFLQVKSNFQTQDVQQPLVPAPVAPVPAADPEGVKKAVSATLLANQSVPLPNGPVAPVDMSNLQVPAALPAPPVPQPPTPGPAPSLVPDGSLEAPLNVVLDPSLENISHADKSVKNSMEHAVHSLKRALEQFTNLTALLDRQEQTTPFSVEGEDHTVKSTLEFLNKSLKQNETAQKILFQAEAFVLSSLTKAANGKADNSKGS